MTLSEEARSRLADVVELQPTKNAELQERWGLDNGSEVHRYLESELGEYYYRDADSLIRATPEAAELVDVEPGVDPEQDPDAPATLRVSELEARILEVAPGPDDRSESVVSVLHSLRDAFGIDPDADEVRSGLRRLGRQGAIEVVYRSVPTFKLAVDRDDLDYERRS